MASPYLKADIFLIIIYIMKNIVSFIILFCALGLQSCTETSIRLTDLRCENLNNPIAIDNIAPHFSWKLVSDESKRQVAYEIQVASDSLQLLQGNADLWNSGRIISDISVMLPYQGKELKSRGLYYWRVRVEDDRKEFSSWSPIQRFAVGILEDKGDTLNGKFISLPGENVSSPLLRKSFLVENLGKAFLHVNSLGYHEAYLNGKKISSAVLSPSVSQLDKRSLIVTYDVTDYLKSGKNELLLWLGKGWYKSTTFKAEHNGPVVRAELDILDGDGEWREQLVTDESWQACESGYYDTGTWNALRFGGERIDARMLPSGLESDELDKLTGWTSAKEIVVNVRKASPQMSEQNKIQEVLSPKSITALGDSTWLVDLGKVITGWFELHVPQLPSGHEIVASYSDYMKPDGTIEEQGESDNYITSGNKGDVFCNKFHHHAFRYVKISHLPQQPKNEDVKGYLIHGDYKHASSFVCSDSDLNEIHDMINYTLSCLTFSGYMVDCPHLERTGYGGDGNSSTLAFQTMYDAAPTYINWLQAWEDVIHPDGSLPHVAPAGGGGGGPYWCGFIVLAPWRTYFNYGDPRLLERCYDSMKKWLGYVDKYTVDGLLQRWPDTPDRVWFLGDWLAPIGVDSGNDKSVSLVNNCFISDCLGAMVKIATSLGYTEDAELFASKKNDLNAMIHKTFYNEEEGIYATGSQLDMAYPTLVGVVPSELQSQINNQLMERTKDLYSNHIGVGLVGVPILTDWAIRSKEVDFMYGLLKQPDYPGYLNMLKNGATTTWEYWNGERSRVHNCYNGIGTWFYQAIGGIRPDVDAPGYKHFYIDPQIPAGLSWANTQKDTPYGTITVNWKLDKNVLTMSLTIPVGTTASLIVPLNATAGKINGTDISLNNREFLLDSGKYNVIFKL